MENVEEVIVDQSVVKNNSEPLIIYTKDKKLQQLDKSVEIFSIITIYCDNE